MKILYLCNKNVYDTKMSRVRFHSMEAIGKNSDLTYSGLGWPNYNKNITVQENINNLYNGGNPDIVVAYKPLELKNFNQVKAPKCLRYNEMWDIAHTTREIVKSEVNLVICHHLNDISKYKHLSNVKFCNISHCAEKTIYKDYKQEKKIDVLFVGATGRHYPFRGRLIGLMHNILQHNCKCYAPGFPGAYLNNIHGFVLQDYAKLINQAKITLTCSSSHKYRLGKYSEIPLCASLLGADLPNEDQDFFKEFMLVLNTTDSNDELVKKILYYIKHDSARNELIAKGLEMNKEYTQEKYAERFVKAIKEYQEDV